MLKEPFVVNNPALIQRFFSDPSISRGPLVRLLNKLFFMQRSHEEIEELSINNQAIYIRWRGESSVSRYSLKIEGRVLTPDLDELSYSPLFFSATRSDFWA